MSMSIASPKRCPRDPAELARAIADRHFGVGGDGLILICPSQVADARMRMFNADGSESEMCGNGVRCVAKYVYDHGLASKQTPEDRNRRGRAVARSGNRVGRGRHGIGRQSAARAGRHGRPQLAASQIPVALPGVAPHEHVVDFALDKYLAGWHHETWHDVCGLEPGMTCVSMGNPHVMLYCRDVIEVPLATVGPRLERARRISQTDQRPFCPGSFGRRSDDAHLGTGQRHHAGLRHRARRPSAWPACWPAAPGATFWPICRAATWNWSGGADDHVMMTGPAVEVFSGEWPDVKQAGMVTLRAVKARESRRRAIARMP